MVASLRSASLIKSMDRLQDASEISARRSEVADIYPACMIGSRALALVGIRTRHGIVTLSEIGPIWTIDRQHKSLTSHPLKSAVVGKFQSIRLNVTMPALT